MARKRERQAARELASGWPSRHWLWLALAACHGDPAQPVANSSGGARSAGPAAAARPTAPQPAVAPQLDAPSEQQRSSSTLADRGEKPLTLVPSGKSRPLVQEELLDAKPLAAGQPSGVCARLHSMIQSAGAGVRRFAEVTPDQQGEAMSWDEVRSRAEANERSPDGTAWELWSMAELEGWRLAALSSTSAAGAHASESELCFRPDGTLAQLTDTVRTRHPEHGLISDTLRRSYGPDGHVLSSEAEARYVQSGKRAEPGTYPRPEPTVVLQVRDLPFAALLTPGP